MSLPKGELRIARQFTAGFESEIAQVSQGSLRDLDCFCTIPPLKGWAILEPPSGRKDLEAAAGSTNAWPKNVQTPVASQQAGPTFSEITFWQPL